MSARKIKRRNAKRMTREFRCSVWWLFGTPSQRKAGDLVALASITFRPDSAPSWADPV